MNKRCAIVVMVYKEKIDADELMSFKRCVNVFNGKYDIILNAPEHLNTYFYQNIYPSVTVRRVPSRFTSNYFAYNLMCMSNEFYKIYSDYEYILIYQLDAYVLEDGLEKFLNLGYDYIGAPIKDAWGVGEYCGCGGLSLRKVDRFITMCNSFGYTKYEAEDMYFCKHRRNDFNISPVDVGLKFCFSADTKNILDYWYEKTNHVLPCFAHIFKKNDTWDFWKNLIKED